MFSRLRQSLVNHVCKSYRSIILKRPTFIAVTGSCGKSTTKELIDAVLSTRLRGRKTPGTCNTPYHVARTILRTHRRDDYCVLEVAAATKRRLPMEETLALIRPRIGVVTNVGMDHLDVFGSIEAIAAEKSKLVVALPADGTAVLNADDPRVLAMQSKCAGRVVTYGLSPDSTVRAEDVRCAWPNRLSFTAVGGGERAKVQTQLCGVHLASNVLAAMTVGKLLGIPLAASAEAIRLMPPMPGRLQPITTPDGITFIRDDVKVPVWTLPATLDLMKGATAARKIMVLGTLSDYQEPLDPTYVRVARQALEVSDFVFFVGRWASRCLRAKRHGEVQRLQAFVTVEHLAEFLPNVLRPGDLVLVRGSAYADRLDQLVPIWINRMRSSTASRQLASPRSIAQSMPERPDQIVVGLGNSALKFRYTPHNIGQCVIDLLAESLGLPWSKSEFGMMAHGTLADQFILMLKPATAMNDTGSILALMADQLDLGPAHFILIHDDINLPIGTVRKRMSGTSGGHKGVQSIISAFRSEDFRRIKVGVGPPQDGSSLARYVLTPLDNVQREAMAKPCHLAANGVVDLIRLQAKALAR
jgi:aminoacyl-tRNA hydrolase